MKPQYRKMTGSLLCAALMLGCKADPAEEPIEVPTAHERNSDAAREMRENALAKKTLEPVNLTDESPVIGEVPAELLATVFKDIETRTGGTRADFEVQRAESVQWRDGSMGCPEPGTSYLQAPLDGYWVVVEYQNQKYDYRGNDRGVFTLCTGYSVPGGTNPVM